MRSHSTPRAPKTTGRSIYEGKSRSAGRVLPDQSAFLENEGLGDSHASHASHASRGDATPGKKQCPPTPQRTPTWLAHSHSSGGGGRREEDRDAGDSLDGLDSFVLNHFNKGGADDDMDMGEDGRDDSGNLSASDLIGLDDNDNLRPSPKPRFASFSGGKRDDVEDHEMQSEMVPAIGRGRVGGEPAGIRSIPASVVRHRRRRSLRRNNDDFHGNLAHANEEDGGFGFYVNEAGADAGAKQVVSPGHDTPAGKGSCDEGSIESRRGGGTGATSFNSGGRFGSQRGQESESDDDFSKQLDFENDGSGYNNASPDRGGQSRAGFATGKKSSNGRGKSGARSFSSSHRRGHENYRDDAGTDPARSAGIGLSGANVVGMDIPVNLNPIKALTGVGPISARAHGLRAGSVSTYENGEPIGRAWVGATRLHRVSSLEGNKVLMNLTPVGGEDPKDFHDFENHGMIGSGAFSDVYKVRNPDDGKFYAVKRSKKRIRNKSDRLRYLQEPKMFQRLGKSTSSNVLTYYRAWQEEGYFYTQTELCSGGNLKNLLEQLDDPPVLPEETIWYVVKQVATGLDQLHTKGLVHMDIKPDNILISDTGVLKLGDLGMARPVNCSEDGLEGDAVYMAPELLSSPVKTRQLDLFSFGVMIWELASGRFPPKTGTRWHKFREGQAEDPPASLRRSKRLCRLIRSLMHPQPRYRPNSEEVLQEAAQALSRISRKGGYTDTREGKKEASGGGEFILRIIQRQALLRNDQAKKRRRTMSEGPTGIPGSSSFQRIAGSGGGTGLRLSIPPNSFDPNRLHEERMGMCTPTDQIVGLSYGMGTPGMATPGMATPSSSRK